MAARLQTMQVSLDKNDGFASALDSIRHAAEQDKPDLQRVVDILFEQFDHYSWVGIYVVSSDEPVLGPWRGPLATEHVRIPIGQGICGAAAPSGRTEIVDEVTADTRYLAAFRRRGQRSSFPSTAAAW
jgi:GAF domain-containing protein